MVSITFRFWKLFALKKNYNFIKKGDPANINQNRILSALSKCFVPAVLVPKFNLIIIL